jgi:hypothetical protein
LLDILVGEALQVVASEDVAGVVHAATEVIQVDAAVSVDAVRVATEAEGLRISCVFDRQIAEHSTRGSVWLGAGATVPVLTRMSIHADSMVRYMLTSGIRSWPGSHLKLPG